MKSTYYTGYVDLDERLRHLYDVQLTIEGNRKESKSNNRIYRETITEQTKLLEQGKQRDING